MARFPSLLVPLSCVFHALGCLAIAFTLNMANTTVAHAEEEPVGNGSFEYTSEDADTEEKRQQLREFQESLQRPYAKAKTLQQAIDALKRELKQHNMCEYESLLTEERVCRAIEVAIRDHEADYERVEEKTEAQKKEGSRHLEHFQEEVKPLYLEMIRSKKWLPGSYFHFVPTSGKHGDFVLDLSIETAPFQVVPGSPPSTSYSLPIVCVFYGRQRLDVGYGADITF